MSEFLNDIPRRKSAAEPEAFSGLLGRGTFAKGLETALRPLDRITRAGQASSDLHIIVIWPAAPSLVTERSANALQIWLRAR